jgi:dTDP-4-amino-4,6-dideoxygalactose transaminase
MCRCGVRLALDPGPQRTLRMRSVGSQDHEAGPQTGPPASGALVPRPSAAIGCLACGQEYDIYDESDTMTPDDAGTAAIPFLDLKHQHATLREQVLAAVAQVLDSQVCIGGPRVGALEEAIAARVGVRHAIGVSSGTDALLATLMALGIGPGDEVITTPFTFFAPAGQMADMTAILQVAARHGLAVIEDAAQAIDATHLGRAAGSLGTAGCLSFFPSKNLGAAGDAGMIVTDDDALAARIRTVCRHGAEPKYFHALVGGNFRLDPLQAAVLLTKLPHLHDWAEARRAHARAYDEAFTDLEGLTIPPIAPGNQSVYNQYVVRVHDRAAVQAHLDAARIGHAVYYPLSLHRQACFAHLGYAPDAFPESDRACAEVLALPIFPELHPSERARVIAAVHHALT